MNRRAIRAIIHKDLLVVTRSRAILIPLIVVPLLMLVIVPGLMAALPLLMASAPGSLEQMDAYLAMAPVGLQAELAAYDPVQRIVVMLVMYAFAPMYLIVPTMVANVIAADSFAGEKERKTLEALLYSPTTDRELILAKMLAAWVPAVLVGVIGFVLYALVANAAAWPVMGRLFFPNAMWIVLAVWVGPAAAGLGLGAMVIVSSRVTSFQEAYQTGAMVVLPIILLVIAQAAGVVYLSVGFALLLGLVLWLVDAAVLLYGARTFRRGEIIARI